MRTIAQLIAAYGDPMHDPTAFQRKWCVTYALPEWLRPYHPKVYGTQPCSHITMHKGLIPHFEAVWRELISSGLYSELKSYDGCYMPRLQRGSSQVSIHAFGLAVDYNARQNPLGGPLRFSQAYLNVWRKHGWTVGADFHGARLDGMHKEFTSPL